MYALKCNFDKFLNDLMQGVMSNVNLHRSIAVKVTSETSDSENFIIILYFVLFCLVSSVISIEFLLHMIYSFGFYCFTVFVFGWF